MEHPSHTDAYVLCSNPRCGTTLTCDLLRQTGVAGAPDSYFRQKSLADWCRDWGLSGEVRPKDAAFSDAFFEAMLNAGRADTKTFGLRLMGPDLTFASEWLARRHPDAQSDRDRIEAAFGPTRFIHLSRADKLAEAVSYLRAEQTGLWHGDPEGGDIERIAPSEPDGYDPDRITARVQMLQAYDDTWTQWFASQQIAPLRLSYEALSSDTSGTLRKMLLFLGKNPDLARAVTPGTRKLADATSSAWIARYRRSHPGV